MKELTEKDALYKAEAYCSVAEHCLSEVSEKLERWGVLPEVKARILQKLIAEKYIDETRYCRSFIHDKLEHNKWGRNKIAQALRLKGISRDVWEPLLTAVDKEECCQTLRSLLAAKRKTIKAQSEYEMNGKLIRFALSRGYGMDEIRQSLKIENEDEYLVD